MAVNTQGSGPDELGIRTLLSLVRECCPQWAVIFISESDFLEKAGDSVDLSPHRTWRHWPGQGSRAMRFVIRNDVKHLFNSVAWMGRSGVLIMASRFESNKQFVNFVGFHGAHGKLISDSFNDLCTLLALGRACSKTLVMGDWHIDILPTLANDPFSCTSNRMAHHFERRELLNSWLSFNRLCSVLPKHVLGAPGGKWARTCESSLISRVPSDDQLGLPSLLDFGAASENFVKNSWLSWLFRFSDHAANIFVVSFDMSKPFFVKSTWRCKDPEACCIWLRSVIHHALEQYVACFCCL